MDNNSSSTTFSVSGHVINYASAYGSTVSRGSKNKTSTKRSSVIGEWRNIDLGFYYPFVSEGWKKITEDDSSSVTGGILNIVNGTYICISEGYQNKAIGDFTSVSGRWKNL